MDYVCHFLAFQFVFDKFDIGLIICSEGYSRTMSECKRSFRKRKDSLESDTKFCLAIETVSYRCRVYHSQLTWVWWCHRIGHDRRCKKREYRCAYLNEFSNVLYTVVVVLSHNVVSLNWLDCVVWDHVSAFKQVFVCICGYWLYCPSIHLSIDQFRKLLILQGCGED